MANKKIIVEMDEAGAIYVPSSNEDYIPVYIGTYPTYDTTNYPVVETTHDTEQLNRIEIGINQLNHKIGK